MKRILVLMIALLFVMTAAFAETHYLTYEDLQKDLYDGYRTEVIAVAKQTGFSDYPYVWCIQKADGSYEQIIRNDPDSFRKCIRAQGGYTDKGWAMKQSDVDGYKKSVREGILNGYPMRLSIAIYGLDEVNVYDVKPMNGVPFVETVGFLYLILVVAIITGVVMIILATRSMKRQYDNRVVPPKVIKTKFIDSSHTVHTQRSTTSTIGRAIVGEMIAGDLGGIIGATTGRNKNREVHMTTFMLYYDNGEKKVETVSNGSLMYKKYMELLDMGD